MNALAIRLRRLCSAGGRGAIKRAAGHLATLALPQCEWSRAVFLLGHMRCGSTALANVLCAHRAISGYGEAHVRYADGGALGRLAINQQRRGAWAPSATHLFDKILHTRYEDVPHPGFFAARAVFLVREPAASIRSIRRLFAAIGSAEYASDAAAADYYEERLGRLALLWHAWPAERRVGLTHAALVADPDAALARISGLLALAPPLANHYARSARGHGSGDPFAAHRHASIVQETAASAAPPPDLPAACMERMNAAYAAFTHLFALAAPAAPSAGPSTASALAPPPAQMLM